MRVSFRRRVLVVYWRIVNPLARPAAGLFPFWVLIETTGCKTGRRRRTPLAAGPKDSTGMYLIAVHGRHSGWVRNIDATPTVRIKHRGRWRHATASVEELDPATLSRFNLYARSGPRIAGIDPMLVRVTFDDPLTG